MLRYPTAAILVAALSACADLSAPHVVSVDASASARAFTPADQQPVADLSRGFTYGIHPAGTGQILAQTFTPARNGFLGYVELPVGCSEGVLLNVKVREGIGGTILYEANVTMPTAADGTFSLIQLFDPAVRPHGIKIRKRTEYALELAAFPGENATESTCGIVPGPAGDSYAGGRAYYQDPINGPAFLPLPTGEPTDDEDLPFVLLMR